MQNITSTIQIHFDGDITENHRIPMRVLGKCLVHTQKAFDRAYLDLKYKNGVYKYARMTTDDYIKTEFWAEAPQEGGYIAQFFSRDRSAPKTADRVSSAINQALEEAVEVKIPISEQVNGRKQQISNNIIQPVSFSELFNEKDPDVIRKYGDRSIAKEIDQLLTILRAEYAGDSVLGLTITGSSSQTFDFNRANSEKFHAVVAGRKVGMPAVYQGKIQSLDRKNLTGKFENIENKRTSLLHMTTETDFLKVHPFLGDIGDISFIGCPLIEFGSLEPNSGDVYFLSLASEQGNSAGDIRIE